MGFDIAQGEQVLAVGDRLGPSELGLLAAVGVTRVSTYCSTTSLIQGIIHTVKPNSNGIISQEQMIGVSCGSDGIA